MSPRVLAAPLVLAAALLLAGCTTPPTTPAGTDSPAPSPSPTASPGGDALGCDDLATTEDVAAALAGTGAAPAVTLSDVPGTELRDYAVAAAGGLTCRWVGDNGAIFAASVLPKAAHQWTAMLFADSPTDERREFGGVSAAAACGDPGCGVSAAVSDSWLLVEITAPNWNTGGSVFGDASEDSVFPPATPAIEDVVGAVSRASAEQLAWPLPGTAPKGAPSCEAYLKTAALGTALGDPTAEWDPLGKPDPATLTQQSAAEERAGIFTCYGVGSSSTARLTVAPGQAWIATSLATHPADRGELRPADLRGLADGEVALSDCASRPDQACTVLFSLSDVTLQADLSAASPQIAQAVLDQAR